MWLGKNIKLQGTLYIPDFRFGNSSGMGQGSSRGQGRGGWGDSTRGNNRGGPFQGRSTILLVFFFTSIGKT